MLSLLVSCVVSLSYVCDYPDVFGDYGKNFVLYKEDNVAEVKWLEKYEYCRAKGDTSVYNDAGQGKCEYSRGICYWDGACLMTNRENDPKTECVDLYNSNTLVAGLDNGRKKPIVSAPPSQPPSPPVQEENRGDDEQVYYYPPDYKVSSARRPSLFFL